MPDFEPLPGFDSMINKTTVHEHVCGVGSAPRSDGSACVRRCRCGQLYHWNGRIWKPMSLFQLLRHRKMLRRGAGEFLDWA
jgi:hypothetical protein